MDSLWETGLGAVPLAEPQFLGIVNVTPDSFSDGGRFLDPQAALAQAAGLLGRGAAALDLGAESTRPGAAAVGPEQEWSRLRPVLALLREHHAGVPLSLDTRHPDVASRGLRAGAAVINDVTGFRDPAMLQVARNCGCGLIAMRSRVEAGELVMPPYAQDDAATAAWLRSAVADLAAIRDRLLGAGIAPERILLDPGFGFDTTFARDLALWQFLPELPRALDWPAQRFCIGISRKRFLAWRAGEPSLPAPARDPLTAAAHREALAMGYRVFRTHAALAA